MSFSAVLTVATSNTALNAKTYADASSYASEGKGTFSDRYLLMYRVDGTLVSPDGTDYWPFGYDDYPDDTITLAPLTADASLNVVLVCVSEDPQEGSVYYAQKISTHTDYTNQYFYGLIQRMAAKRTLENDSIWMTYLMILKAMLNAAAKGTYYQDQYAAQKAIENCTYIITNQQNYFA